MSISRLFTRAEFAQLLGISESSELRGRALHPNWPPHIRVGNLVFYRESAVEQWLQDQEAASATGLDGEPLSNELPLPCGAGG